MHHKTSIFHITVAMFLVEKLYTSTLAGRWRRNIHYTPSVTSMCYSLWAGKTRVTCTYLHAALWQHLPIFQHAKWSFPFLPPLSLQSSHALTKTSYTNTGKCSNFVYSISRLYTTHAIGHVKCNTTGDRTHSFTTYGMCMLLTHRMLHTVRLVLIARI